MICILKYIKYFIKSSTKKSNQCWRCWTTTSSNFHRRMVQSSKISRLLHKNYLGMTTDQFEQIFNQYERQYESNYPSQKKYLASSVSIDTFSLFYGYFCSIFEKHIHNIVMRFYTCFIIVVHFPSHFHMKTYIL